jgi:hypothetical protein
LDRLPKAKRTISSTPCGNAGSTRRTPRTRTAFSRISNPIALDEPTELGQKHFFDTFRLEAGSPFADLVIGTVDLLGELRDEREATFVQGPMTSGRRRTRANGVVRESEPLS